MDPVDRMIIEESPESAKHLLVIDSPELADAASDVAGRVSIYCDDRRDADQVPRSLLIEALDAATLEGVDLVWMRLPKALAALDEYAERISAHALPGVHLVAAGRTKHMTLSMNDVLGKHFKAVSASLGRNKSRALHAIGATPTELTWPRENLHPELSLGVIAHGAVFATNKVDDGTRLLAERCADLHGNDLLDLGCGSGILATLLARANPGHRARRGHEPGRGGLHPHHQRGQRQARHGALGVEPERLARRQPRRDRLQPALPPWRGEGLRAGVGDVHRSRTPAASRW